MNIGIGTEFDGVNFDPTAFNLCIGNVTRTVAGERRYLHCEQAMIGRYVALYLSEPGFLHICEVEVYAEEGMLI